MALITFSDVHLTEIRFDYTDYTNKESLRDEAKAVLDSLTPLGTTHIGNAIKVLLEELNQNGRGYRGASGESQPIVVVTDGEPSDTSVLDAEAVKLANTGARCLPLQSEIVDLTQCQQTRTKAPT